MIDLKKMHNDVLFVDNILLFQFTNVDKKETHIYDIQKMKAGNLNFKVIDYYYDFVIDLNKEFYSLFNHDIYLLDKKNMNIVKTI